MLKFACKDVGLDCDFVATGAIAEEVKGKAFADAASTVTGCSWLRCCSITSSLSTASPQNISRIPLSPSACACEPKPA